jgi:hypothetical protein
MREDCIVVERVNSGGSNHSGFRNHAQDLQQQHNAVSASSNTMSVRGMFNHSSILSKINNAFHFDSQLDASDYTLLGDHSMAIARDLLLKITLEEQVSFFNLNALIVSGPWMKPISTLIFSHLMFSGYHCVHEMLTIDLHMSQAKAKTTQFCDMSYSRAH